jgi:hypothetical protein
MPLGPTRRFCFGHLARNASRRMGRTSIWRPPTLPNLKGLKWAPVSFANSIECPVFDFGGTAARRETQSAHEEVAQFRTYAARHRQTTGEAYIRMNDPILSVLDDLKFYAWQKGIPFTEAFILKGF